MSLTALVLAMAAAATQTGTDAADHFLSAATTVLRDDAPPQGRSQRRFGPGVYPPDAWIVDSAGRKRWLSFGSYCWRVRKRRQCVDGTPAAGPRLRVKPDDRLEVHLRFNPTLVRIDAPDDRVGSSTKVLPVKILRWKAAGDGGRRLRSGELSINVLRKGSGDVRYTAHLRVG